MVIRRGEIWWAELPEPVGSGPGYRRPVLVIQADDFNQSGIRTILVVVITSNTDLQEAPGNVFLTGRVTRLPKDSVVNVSQILAADRSFFTHRVSVLPAPYLEKVEDGLRLAMNL